MPKRSPKQWQQIMDAHDQFTGTSKQFCQQRNIHIQTFYSRRHAMGLAPLMQTNKDVLPKPSNTPLSAPTGQYIKAHVRPVTSAMVLHTPHAQLSLSTQCDPVWLARTSSPKLNSWPVNVLAFGLSLIQSSIPTSYPNFDVSKPARDGLHTGVVV